MSKSGVLSSNGVLPEDESLNCKGVLDLEASPTPSLRLDLRSFHCGRMVAIAGADFRGPPERRRQQSSRSTGTSELSDA